ncbi:MAG TPA: hypothetical protein VFB66_20520 [Tepidisphaeraceae bacterium]|nr:hypothetical protein [Tepidisphaeraceae bacterium]
MGQAANSRRNATLDEQKTRAAGRKTQRNSLRKAVEDSPTKGATGGAFGADGKANRAPIAPSQGAGGGGGGPSSGKDEVVAPAGRSTRPARKRTR